MESPESNSSAEPQDYTSNDAGEPTILHRRGVTLAVPRFRSHADEIDALIGRSVPDAETRKAQMSVDLGMFGQVWGREALDEVYRRASEWLDREEAAS